MNALVLAAGLGTRLRPWTLAHPKALVPVRGVPMLQRVIENLLCQGFDRIVVNVHHFADQVVSFLAGHDFGVEILVSDERDRLLDTGGAILHASSLFAEDGMPVLVHNVDILSTADLGELMSAHELSGADSTLLVSDRESSRKLIFNDDMRLCGWHNLSDGTFRPDGFVPSAVCREFAFSGIHVVGERMLSEMARIERDAKFPIMDFLLSPHHMCRVMGHRQENLRLIDIGKPATLSQADSFLGI